MKNLRKYGEPPFNVVVVHGGPGIPGDLEPLARELSKSFGVLEPLQTKSTIQGQVDELKDVLNKTADLPVTLIGHSWGAMLAFIFTAQNSQFVKKLILISSGEFEQEYAEGIMQTRLSRLTQLEQNELKALLRRLNDPEEKNKKTFFQLLGKYSELTDSFDLIPHVSTVIENQPEIYESVWRETEQLRASGKLLQMGRKIHCPVFVIHGDYDPHPAKGIKSSLSKTLSNVRFIILKECGHYPWLEKNARDRFYKILHNEISKAIVDFNKN